MRKQACYHTMFGALEKRERERQREADKFFREEKRKQNREMQEWERSRRAARNRDQFPSTTPSLSPTENKVIETIVPVFFLIVGIGAVIVPFVYDFWLLFKFSFVCGGIFAILMAFVGLKENKS